MTPISVLAPESPIAQSPKPRMPKNETITAKRKMKATRTHPIARNNLREVPCLCCVLSGMAGSLVVAVVVGDGAPILARVVMSATAIDATALMVATIMLAVAASNNAPFAAMAKQYMLSAKQRKVATHNAKRP
jgi:hypothetical protein